MAKIYTTDNKILSDTEPQIQIGDTLFRVDTRKSTYDKVQKLVRAAKSDNEDEIILKEVFGPEQYNKIKALDLSVTGTMNLLTYVHAAIWDVTFEEAAERFQKAQNQSN